MTEEWLARRCADYVVLDSDPDVPGAALDYWELSADAYARVHAFVRALAAEVPAAELARQRLAASPGDPVAWRAAAAQFSDLLRDRPEAAATGRAVVAEADEQIWIDHWLGGEYASAAGPYRLSDMPERPLPGGAAAGEPAAHVIIPFRDNGDGSRLRNLIGCLHALRDQEFPSGAVSVTVVESDVMPRWRAEIGNLADRYVFAYKDGEFNKSWVMNVGLREGGAPGEPGAAPLTCVLDADILVDRLFLARNVERLAGDGRQAHLPFRWSLSLDQAATSTALRARVTGRTPDVDKSLLRGLLLRDPPGGCLWARTEALYKVGGWDERFEGWGGEDDDMLARLSAAVPVDRFDDPLLHLSHPRPRAVREDGQAMNAHMLGDARTAPPWTGVDGFGDRLRFAPAPAEGSAG